MPLPMPGGNSLPKSMFECRGFDDSEDIDHLKPVDFVTIPDSEYLEDNFEVWTDTEPTDAEAC
jgi:hypothetical protein